MPGFAAGKAPDAPALALTISVTAGGGLHAVAIELATRVAEYLGTKGAALDSIGVRLDALVAKIAAGPAAEITFEFREIGRELVIQARCNDRSSEVRYPLPA
jgi:hypothetical protein